MTATTVSTDWTYRGTKALVLENDKLRATILPEYGAKVFEFIPKRSGRDMLYHNPRVEIRPPVFGVNVDNWWHGGIDECIPTGQPCRYKGEDYPYLGELWSLPWGFSVEKDEGAAVVHLWRHGVISPILVERWVSLREGAAVLENRHRITNVGTDDFDFIWGIHPGIAIETSSRIDLPDAEVIVDESSPNDRLGTRGSSYRWPYATSRSEGKVVDMRMVGAPASRTVDMHYATKLKEGWLSVTDTKRGDGIGLVFPTSVFRCVWLWLVYGGWRGLYCAAVEAWTGYPGALDKAVERGTHSTLAAGESLTCQTKIVGYTGLRSVQRISEDGTVEGENLERSG